jgi:hypothetical protein
MVDDHWQFTQERAALLAAASSQERLQEQN